jgi:hypothetical protein
MSTIERIHEILFEPKDCPPECAVVGLSLPDCVMIYELGYDAIERRTNRKSLESSPRDAEYWIRAACVLASDKLAYICFTCSSPEYAEMAATLASSLLPNHQRTFPKRSLNRPRDARLQ